MIVSVQSKAEGFVEVGLFSYLIFGVKIVLQFDDNDELTGRTGSLTLVFKRTLG